MKKEGPGEGWRVPGVVTSICYLPRVCVAFLLSKEHNNDFYKRPIFAKCLKGARRLSVNVSNLKGLIEGTKTKPRNKINEYHAKHITKGKSL